MVHFYCISLQLSVVLEQWFSTWVRDPRGIVSHLWGVASRYFMCTAVLHFLYSSFRLGSL